MDVPESICVGVGSLHLNRSAEERLNEQEDFEDELRRQKELDDNLKTAFDDLVGDDPSSVNSSHDLEASNLHFKPPDFRSMDDAPKIRNPPTYMESRSHLKDSNFYPMYSPMEAPLAKDLAGFADGSDDPRTRYSPCGAGDADENLFHNKRGYKLQHNGVNSYDNDADMVNQKIKVLYEMSREECQKLAEKLAETEADAQTEINSLRTRLSDAAREIAQTNQKLTASELELSAQHHRIEQLSSEKKSLEMELLRINQLQKSILQEKDRYEEECRKLNNDIEDIRSRLCKKEEEWMHRYGSAERARDEALSLAEQLRREVESTKLRLAESDNITGKTTKQLKEMGAKLKQTATELVSTRHECQEWRNNLQSILNEIAPQNVHSNVQPSPGKLVTVKELLENHFTQQVLTLTQEINNMEAQLDSSRLMEKELRRSLEEKRANENDLIVRVSSLKKQLETLQNSYAELESQHSELKLSRRSTDRDSGLLADLERINTQNKELLKENSKLKSLYLEACVARDKQSREVQDMRNKLNAAQTEKESLSERDKTSSEQVERERRQMEEMRKESESTREELEEMKRKMQEQEKEYANKQKELADRLYKYIKQETVTCGKERESCAQCEHRARTIAHQEAQIKHYITKLESQECIQLLIKELRNKAEFFEQYIVEKFLKIQEQRHVSTNTEPLANGHDAETNTTQAKIQTDDSSEESKHHDKQSEQSKQAEKQEYEREIFASNADLMMKEKTIREQLAEKYTLEIKTIEMSYNKKISELQKQASNDITTLKELLETKAREVEVLKKFIVAERAKMTEVLQAKEKEMCSAGEENKRLREEVRVARERVGEMNQMLDKSHDKNAKLKADLERVTQEIERQKETAKKAMSEMGEHLRQLDEKTTNLQTQHEQLRDKYRSVKKTAFVYKEYATKKDAHVESELERIRSHYEEEVQRLQDKLHALVRTNRQIQVNEKISKMQSDFDALSSDVKSAL